MVELEIIGVMSGTSLDGLDIAHVKFTLFEDKKHFQLLNFKTFNYSESFQNEIRNATNLSALELFKLDKKIGKIFATHINSFIQENHLDRNKIDAIASHGQTIYHQPEKGITVQIGCGASIAFHTKVQVINDFRIMDVIAGGQGAPLVPKGDFDLFSNQADAFLNLGGFANISLMENSKIIAFDISPANLPLNKIVQKLSMLYDTNGSLARSGMLNDKLFKDLNNLSFYSLSAPKSLGTEWLENEFYPTIEKYSISEADQLATISEHIAYQISSVINKLNYKKILATGGGTKNQFLMERITALSKAQIIIPETSLSDFKEAIIFAYLGALFLINQTNCIDSVTGAKKSVIGGCLHKTL
ncbi:MAG: anhydro-N-acetylmuramic acid kinase [Bacteroidetes bacterium]|nr:anhydro-N-acetylmuramic acid kinase [Bacteroidota bacterium]